MLPTPAIRFWSSRNALTGARGRAAAPRREERVALLDAERQLAGAEAARVGEGEVGARDAQPDAGVRRRAGRVEQERAGHAQVHEQERVVLEPPDQVLAPPAELRDRAAFQRRGQLRGRERARPALVEHLEPLQRAVLHVRREVAADRLDLGQLGHAGSA
jgi:hypothetical protein